MRKAWMATLIAAAACDPGRAVHFRIAPTPSAAAEDSTLRLEGLAIAAQFAKKYQLEPSVREDAFKCYYSDDSTRYRRFGLNLCVERSDKGIEFTISEAITPAWGWKGDSLRRELEDTLSSRFKERLRKR